MRVLLVNPPNCGRSIPEEQYGIRSIKLILRGEPLALETLAGNLPSHDVAIVDLKVEPETLERWLIDFAPEVVGITGVTCEANSMLEIARRVKNHGSARVVAGGHHASCDPAFFNRPEIDYVVAGLGKQSFAALVERLARGESAAGLEGVAAATPGRALRLAPRIPSAADLVEARPPRYDLVARYRSAYVMGGLGAQVGFVASAFGCPHRCRFCAIPPLTAGRYLSCAVESVLRDIRLLEGIGVIRLVDANTFGDPKAARRLAERLLAEGLHRTLIADVRADTVLRHPDLIRLWRDAGLAVVVIGFEEISDRRLQDYGKGSSAAANLSALAILKAMGLKVIGDFIVAPDYDEQDFVRLETFVRQQAIDIPMPTILTPIPGTPLYTELQGRITEHDLDYYTFTNCVLDTRMPPRQFYQAYAEMLQRFHAHIG
jgi:radical SAM superfamily enzyme YgiQ (UPF0313 family)